MMKKRFLWILFPMLLLMGFMANTLISAGAFKTVDDRFAGQCDIIEGVVGAEDISFIPNTRLAFVSAYDRRVSLDEPARGGIFLYDSEDRSLKKLPVALSDFRPHGISIYKSDDNQIRLFVINHAHGQHQINVFDYQNETLQLLQTIKHEQLISPNDLVAISASEFYVSNDHGYDSGWMRTLEDYLRLPFSNVVFYDGQSMHEVISGVAYANGINVSADGQQLYLNSVTKQNLYVYRLAGSPTELSLVDTVATGTGIDNIELDEQGNIWIGAHPKLLDFVAHSEDANALSPSQVIKVSSNGGSYEVQEIYSNKGQQLSGSSVAAVQGNTLLMGAVYDEKMLHCQLPSQISQH